MVNKRIFSLEPIEHIVTQQYYVSQASLYLEMAIQFTKQRGIQKVQFLEHRINYHHQSSYQIETHFDHNSRWKLQERNHRVG